MWISWFQCFSVDGWISEVTCPLDEWLKFLNETPALQWNLLGIDRWDISPNALQWADDRSAGVALEISNTLGHGNIWRGSWVIVSALQGRVQPRWGPSYPQIRQWPPLIFPTFFRRYSESRRFTYRFVLLTSLKVRICVKRKWKQLGCQIGS